ncbi:YybH family protein [Maribellus mangrovi]|uniref:YybH family protein n=1 Tax=Maribellus mangrovi TaxID=3133146 RepID=UPI0030EB168D
MKKIIVTSICIVFVLAACVQSNNTNNEADVKAISEVSAAIVKAWSDGNYEAFMERLDQDAIVLPQNASSVVGNDALKSLYSNSFKTFTFQVNETLDEIVAFGDYGYTLGTWVGSMNPVDGGEPIPFNNKAVAIYKRQPDGSWLVYRNIYNSNELSLVQKSPELLE